MDASRPNQDFIDLLVRAAEAEADCPSPVDGQVPAWELDELVRAEVEKTLVREKEEYVRFADISRLAYEALSMHNRAARAYLILCQINGLRRLEPCSVEQVNNLFTNFQVELALLPPGHPRNRRLCSLGEYHAGVFFRTINRHDLEAEIFDASARVAFTEGDVTSGNIARFNANQARAYHALLTGNDIKAAIKDSKIGYQAIMTLEAALRGTSEEHGLWGVYNPHIASAVAYFAGTFFGFPHSPSKKLEQKIRGRMIQLGTKYPQFAEGQQAGWRVGLAICHIWAGNLGQAKTEAKLVLNLPNSPSVYLGLAHLVLGSVVVGGERAHYAAAIQVPGVPGWLKAVAERWLVELAS